MIYCTSAGGGGYKWNSFYSCSRFHSPIMKNPIWNGQVAHVVDVSRVGESVADCSNHTSRYWAPHVLSEYPINPANELSIGSVPSSPANEIVFISISVCTA